MKSKSLLALCASFTVVGCATGGLVGSGGSRSISPAAQQQAAQQHPQIIQEFGGTVDPNRSAYVTTIGRKVGAQTGLQGAGTGAYTFTALNSPVLNAFAVPGGYIYVTRQLMGLANDEAELASVLGHEVGHIAADHSAGRQNQSILTQLLTVGATILTGSSELGQIVSQVGQLNTLRYSRNQEYEADDLGVRYITAAGYDPIASADFLNSLGMATSLEARASGQDERAAPSWAQTHPLSEDRVRRATQQAQATGRAGQGVRNRDQYLAVVDGMVVDDDPAQGVIDGRNFLHPDLRLRFTVPQGYGIQNGTTAVSVVGSNGQAQFSGGSFNGNLGTYIGQVFQGISGQSGTQYAQPRSTTVNGIPAAYSTARLNTQSGQVDVTVFAYQWDSNTAYHFATVTQAGSGLGPFSAMVQSVARLSASEAAAIRPRVIDVVTVGSGDTAQSLANRMAYSNLKLERFLTLNGMQSANELRAGQKVKIVVYGSR